MARLLSKLHGCVVVTVFAILLFLYRYRSAGSGYVLQTSWQGTAHRVIVFGDDWSDTGKHRVSPSFSAHSPGAARDIDRGLLWTETLCEKLECNIIANFAQSLPIKSNNMEHGSLVDLDIHRDARNSRSTDEVSPDFKTQVQQFLDYEKERPRNPEKLDVDDGEWTVFTVYFGLWDLLEYAKLEKELAMLAIDNSIASLFRNLDLLATQVPVMKVVIPLMMDMTFLPRFQATKSKLQDDFAESQHFMVFLWAYWNAVLSRVAKQWNNGEIIMPNPNSILMQQVTTRQLFSEASAGSSLDGGQQSPMFDNVVQPCLTVRSENDSPVLQAAEVQKCADPLAHLFWDDIRLGGIAHQLIGEATASLMRRNQTVNMGTTPQGPVSDDGLGTQEGESFNLKFPPGY